MLANNLFGDVSVSCSAISVPALHVPSFGRSCQNWTNIGLTWTRPVSKFGETQDNVIGASQGTNGSTSGETRTIRGKRWQKTDNWKTMFACPWGGGGRSCESLDGVEYRRNP